MMRNKTLAYYSIRQQERNLWCIHGMIVWNPFLPVCAELSHNIQNPDLERRLDSINYKMEDCLLSQKTSLFNKALNEQNTDDIFFLPEKKSVTSWYKQSRLNKSLSFIALQFNIYCKSDMCLIIIIFLFVLAHGGTGVEVQHGKMTHLEMTRLWGLGFEEELANYIQHYECKWI